MASKSSPAPKAYADGIPVWCSHDEIVDLVKLIPNPKNPNHHPEKQIDLGARVIKAHGWRWPIVVSKRSGFITKGHGRLLFAERMGVKEAPVDYQDYATEADEWQDVIADNRLQEFAEPDIDIIRDILSTVEDLQAELTGYDFDLSCFGTPLEDAGDEVGDPEKEWVGMPEFKQEDVSGYSHLTVHFANQADLDEFAKLVGQKITHKTRWIWFPKQNAEHYGECYDEGEEEADDES